jgi:hypothetical protein
MMRMERHVGCQNRWVPCQGLGRGPTTGTALSPVAPAIVQKALLDNKLDSEVL